MNEHHTGHTNKMSFNKAFVIVFLPFAVGFILSCLFRTMNAVLVPTLKQLLDITPSQLGLLTAGYFLAYALFQVPLGTMLDKFGARKVQSMLFLLGGAGLMISGLSDRVWVITLGRALLGVGMSGGLMAAFKVIVQWFPANKIPILNGIMMTFGGIGMMLSATPTHWLVTHTNWTIVNIGYGTLAILQGIVIYTLVPETEVAVEKTTFYNQLNGLASIYRSPFFWKVAPITTSVLASFMAIHGLWIENWLLKVSLLDQHVINNYLLMIAGAMTISLLSTGYIVKLANYYQQPLERILGLLLLLYIMTELGLIFYGNSYSWLFWILISLISQLFNLSYAVLTQHFQKTHSGRANTALNLMVFSSTFIVQYMIGFTISILDLQYGTVSSYKISFLLPVAIQILCAIWFYVPNKKLELINIQS